MFYFTDPNVAFRDFVAQKVEIFKRNMEATVGLDQLEFSSLDPFVNVTYMLVVTEI